jgi:hypothetical protein
LVSCSDTGKWSIQRVDRTARREITEPAGEIADLAAQLIDGIGMRAGAAQGLHLVGEGLDLLFDAGELQIGARRETEALVDRGQPAIEVAAMGAVVERRLPHGDFGDRRIELGDRRRRARRGGKARVFLFDPPVHRFDLAGKLGKPAFDLGFARGRVTGDERFQPAVEPVDRRPDLVGGAFVFGADFGNQRVDPVGEAVERIEDDAVRPQAGIAAARLVALHHPVEPIGDFVELVL